MRILVVGGTGLIGSAVVARLAARGHDVRVASRRSLTSGLAQVGHHVAIDLTLASEETWRRLLRGIDAVVNCAGVLQDAPGESTAAVHHSGIANLFKACTAAGVRRVIHFSAMGVNRSALSEFSRSKLAGDQALMQLDLDWVILRPSVVIGRGAYGASGLMRGLAALPIVPVMPVEERLQVVWLADVVATVEHFLSPAAAGRQIVELAGPRSYTFEEIVALLRAWMRWPPARVVHVPAPLARIIYRAGDAVALLGWRPSVRSNAQREIARGAVSDPTAAQMPLTATDLAAALAQEPASVQERWFARMYFVKPLALVAIVVLWIATGVISLGPGWQHGMGLLSVGGLEGIPAALTIVAGALADICIGLAIAFRRTNRLGLYAAIGISSAYVVVGTVLVPRLWADPLGPLLKIAPIIALHVAALAIREDR